MSAILGFGGNIFDVAESFDNYVVYRVVDSSLNSWNYEPVYAARGMVPTTEAMAPRLLFAAIQNSMRSQPPVLLANESREGDIPDPASSVPEPSYVLILLACLVVMHFARRACRTARTGV